MQSVLYQEPFDKGIEEGARRRNIELVKNAIKEGMEIDLIAKLTGLSKKEIEKIAEEIE